MPTPELSTVEKRTTLLLAAGLLVLGLLGWLLMPEPVPTSTPEAAETAAPTEDAMAVCTLTINLPETLDTSLPAFDPGTTVEDPLCLEKRASDRGLQRVAADVPPLGLGPVEG